MHKKLTITLDQAIYDGLHQTIGRGKISQFIEDLVRPYVETSLDAGYRALSEDAQAEQEALVWSEGIIGDIGNETW